MDFTYNNDFIPQYNIFNVNQSSIRGNVGINNFYPKSLIEIDGATSIKNNLIINDNIYYNNNIINNTINNDIYILYKLNNNEVNISKLLLKNNSSNNKWIIENNKLLLKLEELNKNSIIEYKSEIFNIGISNIINLNIIVSQNIYITHILILNNDESNISVNNINTKKIESNSNNILYEINNPILLRIYKNELIIKKDLNGNNFELNSKIQLLGKYQEEAGSFWLSNNLNKYVNKSVSIFSNNNYNYELYVNGNVYINNNIQVSNIYTNNLNIKNNLNINNLLKSTYINSKNKLKIDINQLNIGINKNNNFHNIGNTYINNSGLFNIQNLTITNNLNINKNSNIRHNKSFSKLKINNHGIIYSYDLYSKYEIENYISYIKPSHYTEILNISDNKIKINCKTYLCNNNNNIQLDNNFRNKYNLGIFYNTTITGSIDYNRQKITYKNINYNNLNSIFNNLFINNINIKNNLNNLNDVNSYEINVNNLNSNLLIFDYNKNIDINIPGSIYFDNKNILKGNNNDSQLFMTYKLVKELNENTVNSITSNEASINNLNTELIKLPLFSNINNYYNYNNNLIGSLRYNKLLFKYEIHDGNNWNKLKFDGLDNKFVKITSKYSPIISNYNFEVVINPDFYYKIIFLNKKKIKLERTYEINNKTFKIRFNKIYLNNENKIQFTINNIVQDTENINNYTADLIFDKELYDINKLVYVHIELLNNLHANNYYVLIKLNNDNLYKIEPNYENYPIKNRVFINGFKIYSYNLDIIPINIINVQYNNILGYYTCNLFYNYNYELILLDKLTQKYKLLFTNENKENVFYIIDNQLAISINKKTSLGLTNLIYDNINKYYTANIITPLNKFKFTNGFYYIRGNKITENKIYYTIKKKKQLDTNLYEAYLELDQYNT